MRFIGALSLIYGVLIVGGTAVAQSPPQPLPMPAGISVPKDVAYTGSVQLNVDATDTDRHIFNVRERIPVRGGESIVLLYPQWLPGNHSPTGRIESLAGLTIHAGSALLQWTRDPLDVFAFHINVPAGATALDVDFEYLSAVTGRQGRVVMTPDMLNLQ